MAFQVGFNLPQDLPAHLAHGASQRGYNFGRVPVEDREKILVPKAPFRVQAASGLQRVLQADGGGFAKGRAYVKPIVLRQIAAVNDVEKLLPVIQPVGLSKHSRDGAELPLQPLPRGHVVSFFQRGQDDGAILLRDFP